MRDITLATPTKCVMCGRPTYMVDAEFGIAFCSDECRMKFYDLYLDALEKEADDGE